MKKPRILALISSVTSASVLAPNFDGFCLRETQDHEQMLEFCTSMRMRDKEVIQPYQGGALLGCSIEMDGLHNVMAALGPIDGPAAIQKALEARALLQYRNPAATAYVLEYPHKDDHFLNGHAFGAIVANSSQACTDYASASDPVTGWMKHDFTGEVIVLIDVEDEDQEWLAAEMAKYMERGWSVAYNPQQIAREGVDLVELHRAARAMAADAIGEVEEEF